MNWSDFIAYSNQFPLLTNVDLTPRVLGLILIGLENSEMDFEFDSTAELSDYRSILALAFEEMTP